MRVVAAVSAFLCVCGCGAGHPSWSLPTGPVVSRTDHFAVKLRDGRVLVGAGAECPFAYSVSTSIYDPGTNRWSPGPLLRTSRFGASAHLLADGRVIVVGGRDPAQVTGTMATEILDTIASRWVPGPDLPDPPAGANAATLPDGRVVVIGVGDGVSSAEILDTGATAWTKVPLPEFASEQVLAALNDGTVLIAGGLVGLPAPNGRTTAHAWALDPDRRTVSSLPDLPVALGFDAAATLLDGRVLLAGAVLFGTVGQPVDALVFRPDEPSWIAAGQTTVPYGSVTLTALRHGGVLLTGGFDPLPGWQGRPLADDVLLFESGLSDAWRRLPPMLSPRAGGHSATLLDDGRVLLFGGGGGNHCPTPAEVYSP